MTPFEAPTRPKHGPKIVLGLALVALLPLTLIFVVFPLFAVETFTSVEELDPATIQTLRVHLLNRQGIDKGPDVGPFVATPADVPVMLSLLRGVPEVAEFEGARGPWLGEFRIVTTQGRRGTVRFYWQPPQTTDGRPVLRYKIGDRKFEGGDLSGLIATIEAAAERAK